MGFVDTIISFLPEVRKPTEKYLPFKVKLKWTLIVLIAFFILSVIPLYGLGQNALSQFESLSIILGASFGSVMSLGIGPIVTASIVLQLLVGSGILKLDQTTPDGRKFFQGLSKLFSIFFILFEAAIYVFLGGLAPSPELLGTSAYLGFQFILILQLILGGFLVMLMDEVTSKWGFGSGVSLFIAAGVASSIVTRVFSPLTSAGTIAFGSGQPPVGQLWVLFTSLTGGNPTGAVLALSGILSTVIIFVVSVYAQAMKIEIPLSFGRVRGHGIRWPLKFMYTSNIPVILVAALLANVQLWARLLQNWGHPWFGTFVGNTPASGLVAWLFSPDILSGVITGSFTPFNIVQAVIYLLFMVGGAILFSYFWVQTSGMDARSQAKQIMASGLQIPGFRRDERVLEQILNRYITPLTIMGAILVGVLAAGADLAGALSRGTGILLAVMIIYKLYEDIAQQHMMDMHPAMRKMMGGE
ncbi:MAG TPA: preprotein translocase subunit SecY [Candidatus Nanoarchaeia archaeon]|nr:preprotein translocase subunit SecY [Candidatus Nanoarchaeia archaeon]